MLSLLLSTVLLGKIDYLTCEETGSERDPPAGGFLISDRAALTQACIYQSQLRWEKVI